MKDEERNRTAGSRGPGADEEMVSTGKESQNRRGEEVPPKRRREAERKDQGRLGTASVVAEPDRPDEC